MTRPPSAVFNFRIKTIREERWLATLLSVEESAIPFPDEPPIQFPDAAYIKMVTKLRYGVSVTDACVGWETTERMLRHGCEVMSKAEKTAHPVCP